MARWAGFSFTGVVAGAFQLVAACSFNTDVSIAASESDGNTEVIDAALQVDAAEPQPFGFALDPEKWLVPESGRDSGFFVGAISSGSVLNWSLLDIDGDGVLELVQTSEPDTARTFSDVTSSFWKVFAITETGFSITHTPLRLPYVDVGTPGFYSTRGPGWDFADVDNDNILDLLLLTDPDSDELWEINEGVGWQVLKGTGTSLSDAIPWGLPDLGSDPFKSLERCDSRGCWQVTDINGDGFIDLVHTADSTRVVWDAETTPNWHVYLNTGSDFSTNLIQWMLPTPEHNQGFFRANHGAFWRLEDLDGDTTAELVQTRPFPTAPGPFVQDDQPFWRRFKPGTEMFEPMPASWNLPIGETAFDSMDKAQASRFWSTIDIDGDGRLDLVHTAVPNSAPTVWGAKDASEWKVYRGNGNGFASSAISWPVPQSGLDDGFYGPNISEDNRRWLTIDLDGDGQVELVQTADPATDEVWRDENNRPFWKVFRRASNL